MKKEILNVLKEQKNALNLIEINDLLNLNTSEELSVLQKELDNLFEDNIVFHTKKNKYILYENLANTKVGKISINKHGNGFVLLKDEDDLYINYNNLNNAVNDDYVLAETFYYNDKLEGKVIKILKRDIKNLVGTIELKDKRYVFILDDKKKNIEVKLQSHDLNNVVEGTKVLVNVIKEEKPNVYLGKISKIIGHKNDPTVDIKSIAYKYDFFEEFSKETMNQIEEIPSEVTKEDLIGRKDLTNVEIFTIDGDDTKDIDDALSFDYIDGIYHLGVHIADVSYYVKKDTSLDKDAYQRGTSSYLANSVIPMLPHKLSNGICSLNENVIRLAVSCEMEIDSNGNVINYDIFPSFIKSRKKMTYQKVNDILMRNIIDPEYKDYSDKLLKMNELAKILRKVKEKRGYIDFSIEEPYLVIDDEGKCIDVKKRIREDGEKLIEDFMIVANETVASHIFNMDLPFIYRIHGNPKPERIDSFITLVGLMGHKLVGKYNSMNPSSMQKILEQIKDVPEFEILSSILLRSMQKAVYSNENIGHFGLGSNCYTHFTSPIRRYPDLIVHNILRDFIFNKEINNKVIEKWENSLPEIAEHTSTREQQSVEAEREVDDMKMAEYMENHIGEVYSGMISGVTSFGMFVQLDNLVEGLVHLSTLKGDYFDYIPELMSLIGRETKQKYRIGDKLNVKVIGASKEAKTIDFEIVEKDPNKIKS